MKSDDTFRCEICGEDLPYTELDEEYASVCRTCAKDMHDGVHGGLPDDAP